MANARQWEYSTLAAAEEHQQALAKAAGLPRKSRPVTPGIHAPIPDTYSKGAIGWNDQVVDIDELGDLTKEYAIQRTEEVKRHEGKRVRVEGKQVTIPDDTTAVDRGARWADSKPRGKATPGPRVEVP